MYYEHVKGLDSELKVIRFLQAQGWQLLQHRFKTKLAEVDLILQKDGCLRILEVKSISNWDFVSYRLSKKQKERLVRAYHYFQQRYTQDILLELALVV